jgi:hypothetical protein
MKYLLILFSFFICSVTAKADCTSAGISCWPNTSTLKANPVIVLTFYAASEQIVAGLNRKHRIYFRSGEEKISLLIVEVCKGQFRLTQVILKPSQRLKAGKEYQLFIDGLPQYERLDKWNKETRKSESPSWKVLKEADIEFPLWTAMPKFNSKYFSMFGCGPSLGVVFDIGASDASAILVKTTVRNTKTGKYSTYYLDPSENKINVGHGMCAGAFDFDSDDKYEVSFALMDASGNPGCMASSPIRFTRPTQADQEK